MTSIFGLDNKEAVRINVKKCDGLKQPEYKKLCVDPQITSYDTLRNLLTKAFHVKGDFAISYLARDDRGQDIYLSMLSDWDLDAAFFGSSDPVLKLKVDLKPFEDGLEDDWDFLNAAEESAKPPGMASGLLQTQVFGLTLGSMSSQLRGTMSHVGKVMGIPGMKSSGDTDPFQLSKKPMTDAEFHGFLDNVGHMIRPQEFRLSVYQGGVENALRKVVWRHLLNVYPDGMTGQERFDYLKQKSSEYYRLRDEWRTAFLKNQASEEIKFVTNMVKKDVLRTDRTDPFYAGSDDNKNVGTLFNLLTTYALTHPDVSYCQGMSDLASPILLVQNDEAHAYVCFCGLMKRLLPNFGLDGDAMTLQFQHLALLLRHHDPDFFCYLKEHKADDMFFCYRWLLLELKREFPLQKALLMLEIMWSSLVPDPPETEIELVDPVYFSQGLGRVPASPTFAANINAYMKLRSRRQHSTEEHDDHRKIPAEPAQPITPREDHSQTNFADFLTLTDTDISDARFDALDFDELLQNSASPEISPRDKHTRVQNGPASVKSENTKDSSREIKSVSSQQPHSQSNGDSSRASHDEKHNLHEQNISKQNRKGPGKAQKLTENPDQMPEFVENHYDAEVVDSNSTADEPESQSPKRPSQLTVNTTNPTRQSPDGDSPVMSNTTFIIEENGVVEKTMNISSCEEATSSLTQPSIGFINVDEKLSPLPKPQKFGNGNPFLMFLCLALFSLNRDHIMKNRMDYNDMAMFFDKMVRKHNVTRVLHQAQSMYASYLKQQQQLLAQERQEDDDSDGVTV